MSVATPCFRQKKGPVEVAPSPSRVPATSSQEIAMNKNSDITTVAKGASAPSLVYVSDHLSEAAHLMEAIWMAAEGMMQSEEREAIRAVLHYASKLVKGARDDVDAYRATKPAGAA